MADRVALVTGAGGEMGHQLVPALVQRGYDVVTVDLLEPRRSLAERCVECVTASILDGDRMREVVERYRPERVFHLAAVLSAKAEREPGLAHAVNIEGSLSLLHLCREVAKRDGRTVRFLFPSSIAVYGLPDAQVKRNAGAVCEHEWSIPTGVYGANKLYIEIVGAWTARQDAGGPGVEFRSIRFPGLLSAETLPTSGTSDYGPAMFHAAAEGRPYACFVREDARLPFMTMPDAVEAFLKLSDADGARLKRAVYNIRAFCPSAGEFRDAILRHFPDARVTFDPIAERQALVDTWPGDVDDSAAREDWGLSPRYDFDHAVDDYLVPALRIRYAGAGSN